MKILLLLSMICIILTGCGKNDKPDHFLQVTSTDDLNGKNVGVVTGTMADVFAEKHIPGCKLQYFNSTADLGIALHTGKIDAYVDDQPLALFEMTEYPEQIIFQKYEDYQYGFLLTKGSETGEKLCKELNAFLKKLRDDGTLQQIEDLWLGTDEENKVVPADDLTGENGKVRLSMSTAVGAPFEYMKDNQPAGYEIDIITRFCREYGYELEITDTNFQGVLADVTAGKADIGAAGITITEERKKTMLFSDGNLDGGSVCVIRDPAYQGDENLGFFAGLKESFDKTFIKEDRYVLFLQGIGVTLLITILSALFGTVLGYLVYLLYRKKRAGINRLIDAVIYVLEKLPVVILLMVLYYLVFGSYDFDGMWISVIGFTLLFASGVTEKLKVAVDAIDYGQTEAARALGYSKHHTFTRILLPQAREFFMPGYKSQITSLIKDTSIVGYIAVQDLTKISDVIRSRTYEAFFPLIATAIIYFLMAWLLTTIISRININLDPRRRKPEDILKGVKTK